MKTEETRCGFPRVRMTQGRESEGSSVKFRRNCHYRDRERIDAFVSRNTCRRVRGSRYDSKNRELLGDLKSAAV